MMASEYKKRGGGYTTDKKDDKAKHLDQWTEEDWQTKDGSGNAKNEDGTEQRYLPKKAWEQMSEAGKAETDAKKQPGSKKGEQHVPNTSKAKEARKNATQHHDEKNGSSEAHNGSKFEKIDKKSAKDCTTHWDDPDHMAENAAEFKKFQEQNRSNNKVNHGHSQDTISDEGGKKRGRGANASSPSSTDSSNKKQKTKNDEPMGSAGDKTRVPKVGQKVQWHSSPGYVDGEVVEVVFEEKMVEGKGVKGSKEDPRIVLRSGKSGKVVVHKPEAVYFE
jgi:hypothetical protein